MLRVRGGEATVFYSVCYLRVVVVVAVYPGNIIRNVRRGGLEITALALPL